MTEHETEDIKSLSWDELFRRLVADRGYDQYCIRGLNWFALYELYMSGKRGDE